ncbi:hypothetical protein SKAU_G00414000 [Synaphobranchus kaupii]|uniref:Uncharacterized protein n=1 Tax=Synaphobranchus kaupii TaxID=118154 RepID=A0A9Q1IBA6_SYNKA|nr:hypothetical protein SKAU_G00414000 [Synaphobranchus kaupii]
MSVLTLDLRPITILPFHSRNQDIVPSQINCETSDLATPVSGVRPHLVHLALPGQVEDLLPRYSPPLLTGVP